ncbi:hypothetical protein VTI74DRAFT_3892 [Chaetomium olivicolor]
MGPTAQGCSFPTACVLWGQCLLGLHGVPSIVGVKETKPALSPPSQQEEGIRGLTAYQSIDFVIPDGHLEAAAGALAQCNGLAPCPDPASCSVTSRKRPTQPLAFHVHLLDHDNSDVTAGLYLQSDTLWFLPPSDRSPLSPRKVGLPAYFALASDQTVFPPWRPGRGAGVFTSAGDVIIAPKASHSAGSLHALACTRLREARRFLRHLRDCVHAALRRRRQAARCESPSGAAQDVLQ